MICPLSSRQVKYLKQVLRNDHTLVWPFLSKPIFLYVSIEGVGIFRDCLTKTLSKPRDTFLTKSLINWNYNISILIDLLVNP